MWPPNGLRPRKFRQAGLLGEGARADHRVVAPVIALGAVPPGDAVRDQRPIDPAGELLHPREQGAAVDDDRQRLDQPDIGMPLHRRGQPHDRLAGHHAVRVQHQHLRIGAARSGCTQSAMLPALRSVLFGAAAVEDARIAAGARAKCQERRLLGDPDIGVGGVAEDEEVEMRRAAPARASASWIACSAGHHPRRAARCRSASAARCASTAPAAGRGRDAEPARRRAIMPIEAADGAGEGERDPGEQRDEQAEQHITPSGVGPPTSSTLYICQPAATVIAPRRRSRTAAAPPSRAARSAGAARVRRPVAQRLHRHRERRLRRQRAEPPAGRGGQGVHR